MCLCVLVCSMDKNGDENRTCYQDNILATGFGGHLAIPILRKKWRPDMEEGEARYGFAASVPCG